MTAFIASPEKAVKRDGTVVKFDRNRILNAIINCFNGIGKISNTAPNDLVDRVINLIGVKYRHETPTVENIQDAVEIVLQSDGEYEAAKAYILYRFEHEKQRNEEVIPEHVKAAFEADKKYFATDLQAFQFYDKSSRFITEKGRRETWVETVDRTVDFLHELASPYADLGSEFYYNIRTGLLEMRVIPSMRMYAMAGPAARRDNSTLYNCAYLEADSIDSMVELMLLSMAGCGVGYSVEQRCVDKLPSVAYFKNRISLVHVVEDSAEGWAHALRLGLESWFDGEDIKYDFSLVRPAGSVLKTKGGRASGSAPLEELLAFIRNVIIKRQGKRLRSIDVHDIMCAIGLAVVSGGVRRTALISLFDVDDKDMLTCKDGDFERDNSQRWNANNSVVLDNNYNQRTLFDMFHSMIDAKRGEPGIFNRGAAYKTIPNRRDKNHYFGSNPCGEIILRPMQFCNLTAIVARESDTFLDLAKKAKLATEIGTIQSLATYFPNLRTKWAKNCEEERLLGVDIIGQQDARQSFDASVFTELRNVVVNTNQDLAQKLGISQSTATTTVKPGGNSSVLLDSSSGVHARWAPYYIKRVRVSATSPIAKVLKDAGMKLSPENKQDPINPYTYVASFPVKSPDGALTRNSPNNTAIDQCEYWLLNKLYWTEHNPSVTITYKESEVVDLVKWVSDHIDVIGGMAFLPSDDAKYAQPPMEEITKEEYEKMVSEMPDIDWARLYLFEKEDYTTAAQELACSAGLCEV